MKKYILASTSPRRRELLKNLNIEFEIIAPKYEENIIKKSFSYKLVEDAAQKKGESIIELAGNSSVIISADTVVIFNNITLGKPKDFDEALRILKMLNNNTHKVVTSVCVINIENNKKIIKSETSEVTFNHINEEDLKDYIYKFKPYDKAGAYGIQELPESYIKEIKGEYNNIIGLPTELLKNMLDEITKTGI